MNYRHHYDRLIETRKNRALDSSVYYETHHIVMHSMGGDNSPENLVKLTAREHFIAHWLLWRIYRNRQTANAFFSMGKYISSKTSIRKNVYSSRAFKEAREAWSIKCKEQWCGMTPEKKKSICEKMSAAKLGKPARNKGIKGVSEETSRRMSERKKGKPAHNKGKIGVSDETRRRMSKSAQHRKNKKNNETLERIR